MAEAFEMIGEQMDQITDLNKMETLMIDFNKQKGSTIPDNQEF